MTNLLSTFKDTYLLLSKNTRKVWKYLVFMSKKFTHVFPSIDRMAEKIGCNEKTVRRALNLFLQMGWLGWKKRGYNSNLYFLDNELLAVDLNSNSTWEKQQNVRANVHVLSSSPDDISVHTNSPVETVEKEPSSSGSTLIESEVLKAAPKCIAIKGLEIPEIAALTRDFSEFELIKATDDANWYIEKGRKIANLFGFLVSCANKCRKKYRTC